MFRNAGSRASCSLRRSAATAGFASGRTILGWREGEARRNLSDFASRTTRMALRSWRKDAPFQQNLTAPTTIQSVSPGTFRCTHRTFFSPTQHEILRSSTSRFSPLEDFLMDAIAWMSAFSMWYVLHMGVSQDLLGDNNNWDAEDNSEDRHLEYREDYGPTVSQWPSTPKNEPKPKEGKRKEQQ